MSDRLRVTVADELGLRGKLRLVIRRRGRVVEIDDEDNLVMDAPRADIASCLAGAPVTILPVTHVAVGTNGAAPTGQDAAITFAFTKPLLQVSRPSPTVVVCTFQILSTDANGMAIREFGLLRSDGSLYARRTRSGKVIEKDSDIEIDGEWTLYV